MRRTKIVCTIGPACSSPSMLQRLISAGMDVARLNFSHGAHEEHGAVIRRLQELRTGCKRPVGILQDLCGPKVRIGAVPGGAVALKRGHVVTFGPCEDGASDGCIPLPVPELVEALSVGDRLLADDGQVELRITEKAGDCVRARVVTGGALSSHKGITSPGIPLHIAAVTPKDLDDLRFGLGQGVDWVATSFIRRAEDLAPIREVMRETGVHRPVIAKIEKMEAIRHIEEIIESADGIMVARGDLGVEIPIDEVPMVQKRLIALCNRAGKPVITATQMLESMIHNPRPTRAEVTDVANAVLDGSDAVMLSGETAVGQYPVEAVRVMARVAVRADALLTGAEPAELVRHASRLTTHDPRLTTDVPEAVSQAAVTIARQVRAAAILCATTSGSTARLIARFRPRTPVIAATPSTDTFHRLALTWGTQPVCIGPVRDTDQMMEETIDTVVARGLVRRGDRVVLTAGVPVGVAGTTNLIRVHTV